MALIRNHRHWNEDDWDNVADQSALPLDVLDRDNAYLSSVANNGDLSAISEYFNSVTISEGKGENNLAGLAARVSAVEKTSGSLAEASRDYTMLESRVNESYKTVEDLSGRVTRLDDEKEGEVVKVKKEIEKVTDLSNSIIDPGGLLDQRSEQILRATGEIVNSETEKRIEEDSRIEGMIPKPEDIDARVESFIKKPETTEYLFDVVIADPNKGISQMIKEHSERAAESIRQSEEYQEATRDLNDRLAEIVNQEDSLLWQMQSQINDYNAKTLDQHGETFKIIQSLIDQQAKYTTDFVFVPGGTIYQDDYIYIDSKGKGSVVRAKGDWHGEIVLFANNEVDASESRIVSTRASITVPKRFRVVGSEREWLTNLRGLNPTSNDKVVPANTDTVVFYKIYRGSPKTFTHKIDRFSVTPYGAWQTRYQWRAPVDCTPIIRYRVTWRMISFVSRIGIRISTGEGNSWRISKEVGPESVGGMFSDTGWTQEIINSDVTLSKNQPVNFEVYFNGLPHQEDVDLIEIEIIYLE